MYTGRLIVFLYQDQNGSDSSFLLGFWYVIKLNDGILSKGIFITVKFC